MSEEVFRRAAELERDFFGRMGAAGSPQVAGGLDAALRRLVAFMRDHRSALEADPHWQTYFNDLDRVGRPMDADVAEQRRADRDRWAQNSSAAPALSRHPTLAASGGVVAMADAVRDDRGPARGNRERGDTE